MHQNDVKPLNNPNDENEPPENNQPLKIQLIEISFITPQKGSKIYTKYQRKTNSNKIR